LKWKLSEDEENKKLKLCTRIKTLIILFGEKKTQALGYGLWGIPSGEMFYKDFLI